MEQAMQGIYVVGVSMTAFGRMPDISVKSLVRSAVENSLVDAGIEKRDLEAVFFANASQGHMERQHMIRGEIAMRNMGIGSIPVINVENACANGSTAFSLAVNFLKAGQGEVAIAVGAEKMFSQNRELMFSVFDSAWDVSERDVIVQRLKKLGEGLELPVASKSMKPYSVFMDVYAAFARFHMKKFGTTQAQLAAVSAKNHRHSVNNPLSQYRNPYTIEEVLSAPPITYPPDGANVLSDF
jgi:acetyl-CoA acetyltransferase